MMEPFTLGDWIFLNIRKGLDPLLLEVIEYWEGSHEPIEDEL